MRAERISLSKARLIICLLAAVPVVSRSWKTIQAMPISSRLGPTMPNVISGRRARERSRSTSVSSTACAFGISFFRIDLQTAFDDLSEPAVDARTRAQSKRFAAGANPLAIDGELGLEVRSGTDRLFDFGRPIWWLTAEHVIEQGSQRVHVPPRIGNRVQVSLLGRHVKHGPERRILLVRQPRLTEIAKTGFEIVVQQNVGRLQIAVKDPAAVRVDEGQEHTFGNANRLVRRQRTRRQK